MAVITPPSFGDYLRHLRTVGSVATFPTAPEPSRRPKLRRTKVAADAGTSEGYLTKLEQGVADNPSSDLVDRLALALGATDLEHQHLRDLAAPPPAPAHDPDQRTTITPEHREFVDNVHPHLSGYVDEAWNVLYANAEYTRIFRRIEDHGNVLVWFFAERQSRRVMVEWETEARLTVAWLRSHMARRRGNPLFTSILQELARYSDFVQMWERREILMGRHTPYMKVRDLDRGEELTLRAQVFPTPDPQEALQVYLGVRVASSDCADSSR